MILLTFLLQTIRIAIPYLLAAAGGVMSERVGINALGLEGMMLAGAFGAALGSYYGGNPWAGLAGALVAGAMVTAVLAVATLRYKANQVVVGVAINLLVVAATRFYLRRIFDSASNSPRVPGFGGVAVVLPLGEFCPVIGKGDGRGRCFFVEVGALLLGQG